ncbi:hydroxymethylglutaryl-CoA lyase [Pseudaestuariivita sp.]|uniref:hydroxymethylglutaryl-CoA lyase n=1 Tax=Pseudaestuariivita sp. TaxID=2211669 RepID=UPI0040587B60
MGDFVEIFEVGPRDGLQNEATPISVADKVALVDMLSGAGYRRIECASFVSPKWVPQMAGSAEVMAGITRAEGVAYVALTPNMRGLEDALAVGVDQVAVFGAASEGFSRANINASIAESLERFHPVVARAGEAGVPVRGYVSCVVDCPYDGKVAPKAVAEVAESLMAMGCAEVSLGDTLGRATPDEIGTMLDAVLTVVPAEKLAGHYHDTSGQALASIEVSLDKGLRMFDAAVGGLGGCPYAPGAAGNVATEAVLARLTELGCETGLDAAAVSEAAKLARSLRA